MATSTEMGEIEELHSNVEEKDDDEEITENLLNGDVNDISMEEEEEDDDEEEDSQNSGGRKDDENDEPMQIDEEISVKSDEEEEAEGRDIVDGSEKTDNEDEKIVNEEDEDVENAKDNSKEEHEKELNGDIEIHEIIDDEEDEEDEEDKEDKVIELNDSGEGEPDDVMIIETKENGTVEGNERHQSADELEVIELDSCPSKNSKKLKKLKDNLTPRRSTRNVNKLRSYVESDKEETTTTPQSSDESDIEEILPQDPLAVGDEKKKSHKPHSKSSSSTIVVKDTKRLVEIAAKSTSQLNSGGKKEPTLVIIDTNSILSGRGPVPINSSSKNNSSVNQNFSTILPMALPAQGMYPPNMRATITPIPLNSNVSSSSSTTTTTTASKSSTPLLPTLTDDMFVVEAPSFIVPYVYEKPPVKDFKEFVQEVKKEVLKNVKKDREDDDEDYDDKNDEDAHSTTSSTKDDEPYSYFTSPLGKFFIDIGFNLVQEFVQSDLLRQQKRKRDREGGHNPLTNKTIHSLIKNLEFSKENNIPFKIPMKKCQFCNFKTESQLTLAHHLEQPHMKNYMYKCNFCAYEVRSPHDILFHMEAEHAVRGRLERAPAFHQCPNCPFEDNQKGKLSRHLVGCMRKFKPEKNMEPPFEWEPPAKIPRVPKSRQGLNVSAYQAMKQSQMQFLSKMQLLNASNNSTHPLHRGRGRPTLGTGGSGSGSVKGQILRTSGMLYKQSLGGGSVLVPTNYQLSGNQVYQQNQSKSKSVHQPSISITPLPRQSSSTSNLTQTKPGDTNSKNSFVICEICDGYIKDLEQLRNHMQWIHKVKIHPKMIYNRPPLNCQKCQFRFFTDQGLERHLLGSHGLVTSSMQDAANKSKDAGRCPVCGRVYQWKLLNHVARDHNMTLKPAHLSYKCTVCTATFGMYKQFENHVYSAHSVVAKRVMDKKNSSSSSTNSSKNSSTNNTNNNNNNNNSDTLKPLKINDEITIIPQPAKSITTTSSSSGGGASTSKDVTASTSKNADSTTSSSCTEPQLPSNGTE